MTYDEVVSELRRRADAEGGPMFMGWPDRWYAEGFLRRCENEHVSTMTLKSEALGRDACLACMGRVHMTFPEDVDGPLAPQQQDHHDDDDEQQ